MSSARPEGRVLLWVLALPAGLALLLFGMRALSVPEGQLVRELVGQAAVPCLVSIPMLSVVPLAVGLWLLRRGAPTRPVVSGALVGLAVSAGSAAGYALHCSEDSPLFFVVWYGLAIAISTTAGALAGHRLLRW
jgi:hypothetical protein